MNKFWLIVFHTYFKHLKSKAFWVSTIITLLLITIFSNIGTLYSKEKEEKQVAVGIVGETTQKNIFQYVLNKKELNISLISYENEEKAKNDTLQKKIRAYIVLEEDEKDYIKGTYKANEIVDLNLMYDLETLLNETRKVIVINSLQLDEQDVEEVNKTISLAKEPLLQHAKEDGQLKQSMMIVFIGLILIYATVVFYGNLIATEVATEKSSRVMEVLVSSVSPTKQMFGKVIGLAFLNLTQYSFYMIAAFFNLKNGALSFKEIPMITFVYAFIFVILGYFLYAMLLAMFGSVVSRIEDVHQFIAPLNVLIVIGFILSLIGFVDPTTELVTYGSFIPFFAPMLMFLRVALLSVPLWQIIFSVSTLVLTILLFGVMGAKIYKGGVLMYGKTTYKNLLEALKITKNNP